MGGFSGSFSFPPDHDKCEKKSVHTGMTVPPHPRPNTPYLTPAQLPQSPLSIGLTVGSNVLSQPCSAEAPEVNRPSPRRPVRLSSFMDRFLQGPTQRRLGAPEGVSGGRSCYLKPLLTFHVGKDTQNNYKEIQNDLE